MTAPLAKLTVSGRPAEAGLYDPAQEHDACGAGFIADLSGTQTRTTVVDALTMLEVRPPVPRQLFAQDPATKKSTIAPG